MLMYNMMGAGYSTFRVPIVDQLPTLTDHGLCMMTTNSNHSTKGLEIEFALECRFLSSSVRTAALANVCLGHHSLLGDGLI